MRSGRWVALKVLVDALRGKGRYGLGERVRALPRLLSGMLRGGYRGWDRRRALGVLVGLVYIASPVDVVPELLLPLLGLTDDAFVGAWLAGAVLAELDDFLDWERTRDRIVPGYVVD